MIKHNKKKQNSEQLSHNKNVPNGLEYLEFFCSSKVADLDEHSQEWEDFFDGLDSGGDVTGASNSIEDNSTIPGTNLFTSEITVRSVMGDFSGTSAVLSIAKPSNSSPLVQKSKIRTVDFCYKKVLSNLYHEHMYSHTNIYEDFTYTFTQFAFIHHIYARIVFFTNVFAVLALSIWLCLTVRPYRIIKYLGRRKVTEVMKKKRVD
ncbi:hypothetical protein AYI69_g9380 [Smittium culicis]|uniref:Uncharacterized protein n=1 Tax=Smittium culicis TaxID=133412 RepID=A0A1R1XD00_9FUNG|nr:hypothetical protein AYI69_g9380 [Smittium culicis]